MIDLVQKFSRYEKKISAYCDSRVRTYFESRCRRVLANRYRRLRDSFDMRYHSDRSRLSTSNHWMSKISMPLVREGILARRALIRANFRNDPVVTLEPNYDTTWEAAKAAQKTINSNFLNTRFRARTFNELNNSVSKYGAGVVVQTPMFDVKHVKKTQPKILRIGDQEFRQGFHRTLVPMRRRGVMNSVQHVLNYFQDPNVAYPEDSSFSGWIERVPLSKFMTMAKENEAYIKKNVEKVVAESRKSGWKDQNYFDAQGNRGSVGGGENAAVGIDLINWYGTLNINGNEDDETVYYIQMVGDIVVRIQENPNDDGIIPISIVTIDKREEYWFGNTDSEGAVPYENYLNLLLSLSADQAMRGMQQFIFYNRDLGIDVADINNRAKSGGLIPLDIKPGQNPRDMFFQSQFPNVAMPNFAQLSAEAKEAAQRVLPKKDFSRSPAQGGPRNDTATAALMMDEQGDVEEGYYLNQFADGLKDMGRNTVVLLQQYLPERFMVSSPGDGSGVVVDKGEIMGDFDFSVKSTLTKNKQISAMNLINAMTAIQNFKGSGDPAWQNVPVAPIFREWLEKLDLGIDLDKISGQMTDAEQIPQMPMMPPEVMGQMGALDPVAMAPMQTGQPEDMGGLGNVA